MSDRKTEIKSAYKSLGKADRIIMMEHGRIAEQGNHNKLIESKGLYYHMYMLQQSMIEKAEVLSA